jgi:hypothetical protein
LAISTHACRFGSLDEHAHFRLLVVFGRQHGVGDGDAVIETDARDAAPDSFDTSSKW